MQREINLNLQGNAMQQDLKISFEGLLSEEIDIINDWYANYSKFDRNVSLFDAQEVKSYGEYMQFMKEEYENLSFYDDFLLFATDEDSNCAGIATKGVMRGWVFFFSEDMSAKPVFRTLKAFYEKVKSEELTDLSAFSVQFSDFQNKYRTASELDTDNQVFDELLQKMHNTENKHDKYLYIQILIDITPPDRLGELTNFLFSEDYYNTLSILKAFDFYDYQADRELLYQLGRQRPEFRKQLRQMGIHPKKKILWWEKW